MQEMRREDGVLLGMRGRAEEHSRPEWAGVARRGADRKLAHAQDTRSCSPAQAQGHPRFLEAASPIV